MKADDVRCNSTNKRDHWVSIRVLLGCTEKIQREVLSVNGDRKVDILLSGWISSSLNSFDREADDEFRRSATCASPRCWLRSSYRSPESCIQESQMQPHLVKWDTRCLFSTNSGPILYLLFMDALELSQTKFPKYIDMKVKMIVRVSRMSEMRNTRALSWSLVF